MGQKDGLQSCPRAQRVDGVPRGNRDSGNSGDQWKATVASAKSPCGDGRAVRRLAHCGELGLGCW